MVNSPRDHHDPHSRVPSFLLTPAQRLTVRVVGALYVSVALVGALVSSLPVTAFVVLVNGALGAALARGAHRGLHPDTRVPPSVFLPSAVVAGLFVPFLLGMETLGSVGGYLSIVIILLGTWVGIGWARAVLFDGAVRSTGIRRGPPDLDLASLRTFLAALPLEELLQEWRWSGRRLRHDRQVAAQLREALLEEIERRDPRGFEQWLLDGLEGDPGDYISDTNGHGVTGHPDEPTQ